MQQIDLANVSELTPVGAPFVTLPTEVKRRDFSAVPRNRLEGLIRRPRIARYRAALETARARPDIIISHLPRMTAAVAQICRWRGLRPAHLAFSFNFTDLPVGVDRRRLRNAFREVDRFCVFSKFEQDLYANHFGLDRERLMVLDWTQETPRVDSRPGPFEPRSYVSAVGGEGRDYSTLIRAAELLPHIQFVIVARPMTVGEDVPANVQVRYNLPAEATWRIASDSFAMALPLRTSTTCCGQITIVGARLLGIPIISSFSKATTDYLEGAATYAAGDHVALAGLIERMAKDKETELKMASARIDTARRRFDRCHWDVAVADFIANHALRES